MITAKKNKQENPCSEKDLCGCNWCNWHSGDDSPLFSREDQLDDLIQAIVSGDEETVLSMLESGIPWNHVDELGRAPIQFAAVHGRVNIVESILERGASIEPLESFGRHLLLDATEGGHLETVIYIAERSKNLPGIRTEMTQITLVHLAAEAGNPDVLVYLISKGCDPTALDSDMETPLHYAAERGNIECADILIQRGAEITVARTGRGRSVLEKACSKGNLEMVRFLVEQIIKSGRRILLTKENKSIFTQACASGNVELVKYLFAESQRRPDKIPHYCQSEGIIGDCAIAACTGEKLEVLKYLTETFGTELKADSIISSFPLLHVAATAGNLPIMQLLLDFGYSPNCVDDRQDTPLFDACKPPRPEAIQFLLDRGANPNHSNKHNQTALHVLCLHKRFPEMEGFIKCFADINQKDDHGETPLYRAFNYCNITTMELLIANGAVPDNVSDHEASQPTTVHNGISAKFKSIWIQEPHHADYQMERIYCYLITIGHLPNLVIINLIKTRHCFSLLSTTKKNSHTSVSLIALFFLQESHLCPALISQSLAYCLLLEKKMNNPYSTRASCPWIFSRRFLN